MSLSGYANSQTLYDAVRYAFNLDITLFAATGNGNGGTVGYPAAWSEVIAVGRPRSRLEQGGQTSEKPGSPASRRCPDRVEFRVLRRERDVRLSPSRCLFADRGHLPDTLPPSRSPAGSIGRRRNSRPHLQRGDAASPGLLGAPRHAGCLPW
jgi:hypothetical protein